MSERNSIDTASERNSIDTASEPSGLDQGAAVSERRGVAPTGPAAPVTGAAGRPEQNAAIRERNNQDAATVFAVVLAMSSLQVAEDATTHGPRSAWGDPAHRLGGLHPSPVAWWASAMPR